METDRGVAASAFPPRLRCCAHPAPVASERRKSTRAVPARAAAASACKSAWLPVRRAAGDPEAGRLSLTGRGVDMCRLPRHPARNHARR